MAEDQKSRITGILVNVFVVALVIVGALFLFDRESKKEGLRVCSIDLKNALQVWINRGQPEGEALLEFMRDFPPESGRLFISNRVFVIGGSNIITRFASTRLGAGTLFVTTNGGLVLLDGASGEASIVPGP